MRDGRSRWRLRSPSADRSATQARDRSGARSLRSGADREPGHHRHRLDGHPTAGPGASVRTSGAAMRRVLRDISSILILSGLLLLLDGAITILWQEPVTA